MILNKTLHLLSFAGVIAALIGCVPQEAPAIVPGKFAGKPIPFPVKFHGAGILDRGILTDVYLLNVPIKCSYIFGKQKGTFTTPTVVNFTHTNKEKSLNLDCHATLKNKRGLLKRTRKGEISGTVKTTYDASDTEVFIGRSMPNVSISSYNSRTLRTLFIQKSGVQLLPNNIVVNPIVKYVSTE